MFKKDDRITHPDYGEGYVFEVDKKAITKYKDKDNKVIISKGMVEVVFDSEPAYLDNGRPSTVGFTLDGRPNPVGSGYFWKGTFNPFACQVELVKI